MFRRFWRKQVDSQCLDREYLLFLRWSVVTKNLFGHFQRTLQLYMMTYNLPRAGQSKVDPISWCSTPTALPRATGCCCSPFCLLSKNSYSWSCEGRWLQRPRSLAVKFSNFSPVPLCVYLSEWLCLIAFLIPEKNSPFPSLSEQMYENIIQ